jgi:2TM domain
METKNQLRKMVRSYLSFETHLTMFIVVNSVLWMVFLLGNPVKIDALPIYISIGWSVILMIHCLVAYEKMRAHKKQ